MCKFGAESILRIIKNRSLFGDIKFRSILIAVEFGCTLNIKTLTSDNCLKSEII